MNHKYLRFRKDWEVFTKNNKSLLSKLKHVIVNPGIKMVLCHRLINEMPNYLYPVQRIMRFFYHRMMYKYGIDLPLSLKFGKNLRIYHFGGVVINPDVKIGDNVTIMHNVTIGNTMMDHGCPHISDGVFIGTGAVLMGNIFIAKSVKIGANAVVTKSVELEKVTVVGNPAKIKSNQVEK